jgi:hypothetical protein
MMSIALTKHAITRFSERCEHANPNARELVAAGRLAGTSDGDLAAALVANCPEAIDELARELNATIAQLSHAPGAEGLFKNGIPDMVLPLLGIRIVVKDGAAITALPSRSAQSPRYNCREKKRRSRHGRRDSSDISE